MISFHPDRTRLGQHQYYARGWRESRSKSIPGIARLISMYATSPGIFTRGVRRISSFTHANWLAIDVDDGAPLAEALERLQRHAHIIGTTKSHGLQKGDKGPRDRYRVWVPFEHTITRAHDYRVSTRYYAELLRGDPQACDAARLFLPCREIVSIKSDGLTLPIVRPRMVHPKISEGMQQWVTSKNVPAWLEEWMRHGVPAGYSRNSACYVAAIWLTRAGDSEDQIVRKLMQSRVPVDSSEKVQREVEKAVRNGAKVGRREP